MPITLTVKYTDNSVDTEYNHEFKSLDQDERAAVLAEIINHLSVELLLIEQTPGSL